MLKKLCTKCGTWYSGDVCPGCKDNKETKKKNKKKVVKKVIKKVNENPDILNKKIQELIEKYKK